MGFVNVKLVVHIVTTMPKTFNRLLVLSSSYTLYLTLSYAEQQNFPFSNCYRATASRLPTAYFTICGTALSWMLCRDRERGDGRLVSTVRVMGWVCGMCGGEEELIKNFGG